MYIYNASFCLQNKQAIFDALYREDVSHLKKFPTPYNTFQVTAQVNRGYGI
jgi:hypothetical protein